MISILYYRFDLTVPAKEQRLVYVSKSFTPICASLADAHALAIEWAGNTRERDCALVYQLEQDGQRISLTHYLPNSKCLS